MIHARVHGLAGLSFKGLWLVEPRNSSHHSTCLVNSDRGLSEEIVNMVDVAPRKYHAIEKCLCPRQIVEHMYQAFRFRKQDINI